MRITADEAIKRLKDEHVVALPTETVYGLAASIDSIKAIKTLFQLKQRPLDHPLIVHIATKSDIDELSIDKPAYVSRLIEYFWPGPVTLILKKSPRVNSIITANQNTVAIRMPNHKLTLDIIKGVGKPLVAPSANRFCQTSPTSAEHVEIGLGPDIQVVDGGSSQVGIESTIIDATEEDKITLLRPGMVTAKQITDITNISCIFPEVTTQKFSGSHKKHYAPIKPILIVDDITRLEDFPRSYCLLRSQYRQTSKHKVIKMPNKSIDYAKVLYKHWYLSSSMDIDNIIIERPPITPEWQGIHDRINKAAYTDD